MLAIDDLLTMPFMAPPMMTRRADDLLYIYRLMLGAERHAARLGAYIRPCRSAEGMPPPRRRA